VDNRGIVMRKIEQQMMDAIKSRCNWAGGNTQVTPRIDSDGMLLDIHVFLHGNHIATIKDDPYCGSIVLVNEATVQKWPTNTTRSRLRAMGVPCYIKQGEMYGVFEAAKLA
jgi:hypothetical protein